MERILFESGIPVQLEANGLGIMTKEELETMFIDDASCREELAAAWSVELLWPSFFQSPANGSQADSSDNLS